MDKLAIVPSTGPISNAFDVPVPFALGPSLIRICRIKTAIAKGIMLGTSANGTGTSKAFEIGPVEGTIASLSMLLTAGASLVIVPLFLSWIH
ncbi:LrgB family protein, partial [Bacillus sp. HC-TM]